MDRFVPEAHLFARSLGLEAFVFLWNPVRNGKVEQKKTILSESLRLALLRCIPHFLPISIVIFMTYYNLTGFFIGQGINGAAQVSSSGAQLLLQIAAKATELLIIGSIATVVTDIVRRQAISDQGIPQGLLGAGVRFSQPNYLWSPAYIFGGLAIRCNSQRVHLMLIIALGCLLALFAGPSVALLLMPSFTDGWYAGGTSFYLIGTDDEIYPNRFDSRHTGGEACRNVSSSVLSSALLNMSSCIWNGFTQLSEGLKDRKFDWQSNVTLNDGIVKRQILRQQSIATASETWAVGVHLPTAMFSRATADEWNVAIRWSTAAKSWRFSRYIRAVDGQGTATVSTWIPAVRVACFRFPSFTNLTTESKFPEGSNKSSVTDDYPAFVPFPSLLETEVMPEGYAFSDYRFSENKYINRTMMIRNVTYITTEWLDRNSTVDHPNWGSNAHLGVVVPYQQYPGFMTLAVFSCTVDSRWAQGNIIGRGLPVTDNMVQFGAIKHKRKPSAGSGLDSSPSAFLPVQGPYWRTVSLEKEWLDTLTPIVDHGRPGWSTLAASFTYAGMDNHTGLVEGAYDTLGSTIETEIATTVVDGMSRMGLSPYSTKFRTVSDRVWMLNLPVYAEDKNQKLVNLLRGRDMPLDRPQNTNVTTLHWDVSITGYAYQGRSTPAYLALAVLFTYTLMALTHTFFLIFKRKSSACWDSLEELVVLCKNSRPEPNGGLKNTCGGIRRAATFRNSLRIAAVEGEQEGYEQIQLKHVDPQANEAALKSQSVTANKKYGAIVPNRVTNRVSQRSTLVDASTISAPPEIQLNTL